VAHQPAQPNALLAWLGGKPPSSVASWGWVSKFTQLGCRGYFPLQGFIVLGDEANGAVPELTRLMHAPDAQDDGLKTENHRQ